LHLLLGEQRHGPVVTPLVGVRSGDIPDLATALPCGLVRRHYCRFPSKNYSKADNILANSVRCTQCLNWKDCINVSMSCLSMPLKSAANSESSGSASRICRTSRSIIH